MAPPILQRRPAGAPRRLLHVGCGVDNQARLPACFRDRQWQDIRLDIDPAVGPDIVGSITDLGAVADASIDALYCSHNLEHLHTYEVPRALAEFRRVLKPTGFALVTVPDLRAVARHIVDGEPDATLYQSAAGPINALDMLFGHQASLQKGNGHMAHRSGFSAATLGRHLIAAGFTEVRVHEGRKLDLWAVATLPATAAAVFDDLAGVAQ
jgi:SAM-dependent methyltransferase